MVTSSELSAIYEQVGEIRGWDFSGLNLAVESAPWEWDDLVRRYLKPDARVLDLGTGGGEVFSAWSPELGRGLGIDRSAERIAVAQTDRLQRDDQRIEFALMDGGSLAIADATLNLVLAHYADYTPAEVARVLAPGGVFMTLQMGDRDTQNIFDTFRWGSYGTFWRSMFEARGLPYTPVVQTADQFRDLGLGVLQYEEYDLRQRFLDMQSLVFWLKASPLPERFDPEHHADAVTRLVQDHGGAHGIETNAHRELLVVRR